VNLLSVAATLRANLYLLSLDGITVLASKTNYSDPGTPKSFSYTFATPRNYYVRVEPYTSSYDDYGDYSMRITSVVAALLPSLENVSLTSAPGSGETEHSIFTISNSGPGSINWSIASDQAWLHVSPNNGTAPPNTPVQVWADRTGLPLGNFGGHLTITAAGVDNSPYVIPVTLEISERTDLFLPVTQK
jgi:hypothetical protein